MNFLTEFSTYSSGTEAPENYSIWAAIGTMSAVLQGRVWLRYGRFTVLPNTYIVLLGPPGNGKTTVMNFGQKIIRELPTIAMSAQAQTKESLVKEIFANQRAVPVGSVVIPYAPMAIFITELSHFLGPNSGHMIDFLTTVYDQDKYDNKTKNKGSETILGPYVSILACTTPEWVSSYLKTDIITGGFTRRAIFVNEAEGSQRIPWPDYSPEQQTAFNNCVSICRSKLDLAGEVQWTNDARKWFNDWYLKRDLPKDPTIRGFHRTKHMQMIKVGIIVACCESDNLKMTAEHLQIAEAIVLRIEPNMAAVFNAVGRNELHAVGAKILELVNMNGGMISEKQVMMAMSAQANGRELYEVITALIKTDQLVRMEETKKEVKRVILVTPSKLSELKTRTADPSDVPVAPPSMSPAVARLLGASLTADPPSAPGSSPTG